MVEARGGKRFAVFFFAAAFLVLFVGRWVKPVNNIALSIEAPFAAVINGVASGVGDTLSAVFDAGRLRAENQTLTRQNAKLVRQLILAQTEHHEIGIFKSMVKFEDDNGHMDYLSARVISGEATGIDRTYVVINKGSRDGLKMSMTVLDQNGYFVGSISDVGTNWAKVLLMWNPSSSVGALDLTTQAQGAVEGTFNSAPQLRYVLTGDKLRKNDLIVTSGQWNLYPRNLLLGQVVRVHKKDNEMFQTADIRPAADLSHLEIVQVVRNWVPNIPTQIITTSH